MKRHNSIIKMAITIENYEFYALDYLEGNLDETTQKAMDQFLNKHPEILAEMEEMKAFVLEPEDDLIFEKKDSLKKEVVLVPENKSSERRGALIPIWTRYAAAAAVILGLIWTTVQMTKSNEQPNPIEIVEKEQNQTKPQEQYNNLENIKEEPKQQEVIVQEEVEVKVTDKQEAKPDKVLPQNNQKINQDMIANVETKEPIKNVEFVENQNDQPIAKEEVQIQEEIKVEKLEQRIFSTQSIAVIDIEQDLTTDKIKQKNAVVELSLLHESQMLVEALNSPKQKQQKKWKTPFGTIKWGEVAEALTPESYFASK
jgi:hypothetical protein